MEIDQPLTDEMVDHALVECAQAHFAGDRRKARLAILRGQCEHCECISAGLVRAISEYLGQIGGSVKAVYRIEPADAFPEEGQSVAKRHTGIHLVVWVERKGPALRALAKSLETAVASSQQKLGCPIATDACYALTIELVDDRDISERRGAGLMIQHRRLHSRPVWEATGAADRAMFEVHTEPQLQRFVLPESFDPELIPEDRLIEHALTIERLPPENRELLEHHLTELKVTLIRRLISDHLDYINIAKQWLRVEDLSDIYQHRIGFGRIGGKSAGMLLAGRILSEIGTREIKASVRVPESFFLGSDLMYIFMAMNGLMHWNDQKYKAEAQIRQEYPIIKTEFTSGQFPPEIVVELQAMLEQIGAHPLIVRSSSQLEDSLGTSFAGKYDSHFCANQGNTEENLQALVRAIALTYASTFKPEALLYRRTKRLQDYDERMAVLIQVVQGERWGRYYLPFGAGVAFSRNLYRWAPQISQDAGFVRLVWGLGTRAVERVGNDYPRMVALSHPTLHPDDTPEAIRRYSQQFVDVIDLHENILTSLPIGDVLDSKYPDLRLLVQLDEDGYLRTPVSTILAGDMPKLTVTFDGFLRRTGFASLLSSLLRILEDNYHVPVDVEFTTHIEEAQRGQPQAHLSLLQCRPQSQLQSGRKAEMPDEIPFDSLIFSTRFMVPHGYLPNIHYVLFVEPGGYFGLKTMSERTALTSAISRLNASLEEKAFICVGPGRWGTTNPDLGVYVNYADICNAGALVELSGKGVGPAPEASLGTHFFQDLMEANIYPLAVQLDDVASAFNRAFFYETHNCLPEVSGSDAGLSGCLRLIDVSSFRAGHHIEVIMDSDKNHAVAIICPDEKQA
jgi:hypothetical protein